MNEFYLRGAMAYVRCGARLRCASPTCSCSAVQGSTVPAALTAVRRLISAELSSGYSPFQNDGGFFVGCIALGRVAEPCGSSFHCFRESITQFEDGLMKGLMGQDTRRTAQR